MILLLSENAFSLQLCELPEAHFGLTLGSFWEDSQLCGRFPKGDGWLGGLEQGTQEQL